jgi:hypothetical protein
VSIFVEETGKTGFAHLVDLASASDLAQVNPGDFVELSPSGPRVVAKSNGVRIGAVEPRVAARLLRLMADGNKYAAGVTSLGDKDVRIIIRETYQDPANYGKVSFPTAAKVSDLRPYTKGTLVREEADLEEDLEFDEEPESLEDVGSVLPAQTQPEEGFQIEGEGAPAPDDEDDEQLIIEDVDEEPEDD